MFTNSRIIISFIIFFCISFSAVFFFSLFLTAINLSFKAIMLLCLLFGIALVIGIAVTVIKRVTSH